MAGAPVEKGKDFIEPPTAADREDTVAASRKRTGNSTQAERQGRAPLTPQEAQMGGRKNSNARTSMSGAAKTLTAR